MKLQSTGTRRSSFCWQPQTPSGAHTTRGTNATRQGASLDTDHFRNGRFFNPGVPENGTGAVLRWMWTRKRGPWRPWIESEPGPKPPVRLEGPELRTTFIGHATVLLQTRGINFLTDPVWSLRASPLQWLGPKRHRAAGIRFEDLPKIDCVLLSHNHYDHLDKPTLRRLAARDHPEIFCPLGLAQSLRELGFVRVHELDWWQGLEWRGLCIHAVPAQHFAARTPFDRNRTLWCGWVVDIPEGAVYFAADSGFGTHFEAIAERFPAPRLSLLPIGAYKPEWFMGPIHMTPDEALKTHALLRSHCSVAIHFGTFSLADDGEHEPTDRLRAQLAAAPPVHPFLVLAEGEALTLPPQPPAEAAK